MKLNYLQINLRSVLMLITMAMGLTLFAQPANDICSNAISINVANDAASCVWTNGTTIGVVDGSTQVNPASPCSVNFVKDDVWYKFSVPADTTKKVVTVRVEVGSVPSDMPSVGLQVYSSQSCAVSNTPIACLNFAAGADTKYTFSVECGVDYLVRIYSSIGGVSPDPWTLGQGTFRVCAYFDDGGENINRLWGTNGEGTFDGGLNGWTVGGSVCGDGAPAASPLWEWRPKADSHGPLWGGQVINSHTACNGAMLFDSDYWDGAGGCIANQEGWLESPTIDISGFNVAGVALEFRQRLTQFQSQYFIDYSIDDGMNWQSIEINQEVEAFTTATPPGEDPTVDATKRVYLAGAAGASKLKVRFREIGNYYYWLIDDVFIVEREGYNLAVNDFYAIAPNKMWAKDQLECFGGLADIANNGSKNATNTKLKLEISDPTGVIFTDVLDYGTVPADSVIENVPMTGLFCHPNKDLVMYSGRYSITNDSTDFDYSDNERSFDWVVTDSTMAKENLATMSGGVTAASDNNFTWGNIYHVVKTTNDQGQVMKCNTVEVGISNGDELGAGSASIFVFLYKWVNANDNDVIEETEKTTVGYTQYEFNAGDAPNTLYTLPMYDFNTFDLGAPLEAGAEYVLVVQYAVPTSDPTLRCFINSDGSLDYSATNLKSGRFSHAIDVGNTGELNASTFTGGTVPVVRMNISHLIVGTQEPKLDPANKIVVAPNPVANDLNVKIDLVSEVKNAKVNITDINGKVILKKELNNIKSTAQTFNVSNLANGSYFFNFSSEAGTRTVRFIVSK